MRELARQSAPWAMLAGGALACGGDGPSRPVVDGLAVEEVVAGLTQPVYLTAPPNDDRLFVVERAGLVHIVQNGELLPAPYLDIRERVGSVEAEQGLLSIAFHPQYSQNGYVYASFTDLAGDTRIERYTRTSSTAADPATAMLIFAADQPAANHNGGHILFTPDGRMLIALGDGGGSNDIFGNAQDLASPLGKILRIDVDAGTPYAIPPDNPFAGQAGRAQEIWAYGLRNPWRIAIDAETNRLYIADVGQNQTEEINVAPLDSAPVNYGWPYREGGNCVSPTGETCLIGGLKGPTLEYRHSEGCSVTGGYVYRGQEIPTLMGHYFYSDSCRGWLRSFRFVPGIGPNQTTDRREWSVGSLGQVYSFGEDAARNLYVLGSTGRVFRIVAR